MQASDILNKLLEETGLNAKMFSEKIGLDRPQAIYDIQKGKTKSISQSMADKIISVFSNINKAWLLTGEGEMLRAESTDIIRDYFPIYGKISNNIENQGIISIPVDVWNVIKNQSESLKVKDNQVAKIISMLEESFELIKKNKGAGGANGAARMGANG